jgi:hypothetical protein
MTELVLEIDDTLMARLREKAEQQQRAVEDIVVDALWVIDIDESKLSDPNNFALTLAEMAEQMNLHSGRDDISENFDAVMNAIDDDK